MPLTQLLESLEGDAREEADRLLAGSRAEVQALLGQARDDAARLARAPVEEAETAAAAEAERIRAEARLHRLRVLREAEHEAVEEILSAARKTLRRLRDDAMYGDLLLALAGEAYAVLPSAEALCIDARDERFGEELAATCGGARVETALRTDGGVVLRDGRGRVVRNTLEERLVAVDSRARRAVAARLREGVAR